MQPVSDETAPESTMGGKYLTFRLGPETFGLYILHVHEIIGLLPIVQVPRTPVQVRGVINLRGRVIPVTDLRRKLGMPDHQDTERTCIVVVHVFRANRSEVMGLIVDEVAEVLEVVETQIEPAPSFGNEVDSQILLGVGKVAEKTILLLDLERLMNSDEALAEAGVA